MKRLIHILLIFIPLISIGQTDSLTYFEKFRKPLIEKCDSLFKIKDSLKNGEYKIYYDNDEKYLGLCFNIIDGDVDGLFRDWDTYGLLTTIGYYYQDSSWTFRKGSFILSDTIFKIGNWRYYSCIGPKDQWEDYMTYMQRTYKMIYNRDSLYHEVWNFKNGDIWKESVYHIKKGLISEEFYYSDGNIMSELQSFSNCIIEKSFEPNGILKQIKINGKIEYSINLAVDGSDNRLYGREKYIDGFIEKLYLPKDENKGFQERQFDSNGTLRVFTDYKNGIKLTYNDKGELLTVEEMKKGVWKIIKKNGK